MTDRPAFSLKAAAAACGVSLFTIRRRREAGEFPNALMTEAGWRIPVEDLLAAGLRVNAPTPPEAERGSDPAGGDLAQALADLARERQARELAEAEARHLREIVALKEDHLQDVRRAMLALTAGPVTTPEPAQPDAQGDGHDQGVSVPEQQRGRWWSRRPR